MKEFDTPMVTVSKDHYDQLQECKRIVTLLWMKFGPYEWPKEFRMPKGKTFADLNKSEFDFYLLRSSMDTLFEFDDSE